MKTPRETITQVALEHGWHEHTGSYPADTLHLKRAPDEVIVRFSTPGKGLKSITTIEPGRIRDVKSGIIGTLAFIRREA